MFKKYPNAIIEDLSMDTIEEVAKRKLIKIYENI